MGKARPAVDVSKEARRELLRKLVLDRSQPVWSQGPGQCIIFMYYDCLAAGGRWW
jgi:hypothetical protein